MSEINTNKFNVGVIGGSGIYQMDGVKILNEHSIDTPFGRPSDVIVEAEMVGSRFFFLPRHSRGHQLLPHEINYRANIFALKKLGVHYLVSVSAVGSLKEELPPTTFVLPDQFIDWTKGKRERTFFGDGIIGHVSVANPIDPQLMEIISGVCKETNVPYKLGGTYICIEGPQFSTRAESELYRSMNASIIGMTNVPEAYLAKEAGMAYATIAMVTDFDCWKDHHCTVGEILEVMGENNKMASKLLLGLIPKIQQNKFEIEPENKKGVMTPRESLSKEKQMILDVLIE